MPQKYDKYMRPLPGFRADHSKQKAVSQTFEEAKEKRLTKRRARQFLAEPEELKILEALDNLPENIRADAAEGLLISRVAKRKGLIK